MSEYTPTISELREAWLSAEFEERDSTTSDDDLRAEFDRALAAHDAEVRAGVVAEEPGWEGRDERGFGSTEILVSDYQGEPPRPFTVQQSSLATECKVWIGSGDHWAHMGIDEATRVRDALNAFLADAWVTVEEEVEPQLPSEMTWSHSFMTASGVGYVETYHSGRIEVQIEHIGEVCGYRPLPADANSSAITDLEFVAAIAAVLEEHQWATIYDLQNILGVREGLIRAKARRTYRRGLTVGCICGCRGDFRLTPAGQALAMAH